MYRSTSGESATGFVLGMQATEVTPPAAAASQPVRMSSLWVKPGSRRWTCMSTSPGSRTFPPASSTVSSGWISGSGPTETIFPPAMRTLPVTSRPSAGLTIRAFAMT